MFGWYSIVHNNFWGWKKQKPFLHLSLGKAGPFTLESHIRVKALKCKVFQIIRCLIKPLFFLKKNSTQTIFQGGTPWVAQLLNNMHVWMVLFCAQQLFWCWKNISPPFFGQRLHDVWEVQALKDIEFLSLVVESFLPAESSFEVVNCWAEVILSHCTKLVLKGFAELLHLRAGSMKDPKRYKLGIGSIINLAHLFRCFIQVIYQLTGALFIT